MAIVGALVVGIGAYRIGLGSGFASLQFAADDADAIAQYLKTCWPSERDLKLVTIQEDKATATALVEGLAALKTGGPYELCWVFLSGHGWVDESRAGLLVQPDNRVDGLALLDASKLDELLDRIAAQRTILVLDCCFAEGIVRRMPFFTALGPSVARLYVASSRERQRTWEDDRVKHGVFTAHLLDLLTTGSAAQLGGRKDRLDVDAELFPLLCEQVPLYVLERKSGAHQEPVKGGVSRSAVTLPVANVARRLRDRTALGTALRRLRQIVAGFALAGLALLFFAYTLIYYVEPGSDGTLVVRHGTRWLQPLLQLFPLTRVDTGIPVSDLSDNGAAAAPLQSGYTTGIWTHDTPAGYRGWFTAVLAGLNPVAAARYATLVGEPPPPLGEAPRPSEVERAAWMALSAGRPESLLVILSHVPGRDRLASGLTPLPVNEMDFQILDLTEAEMESYAQALAHAATLDPIQTFPAYLGFAKSTQEWLTHNTDVQRGRDARAHVRNAVADVLGVIARARTDRGVAPLDPKDRALVEGLAAIGYADVLGLGLTQVVSGNGSRIAAATEALPRFQGDPDDPGQWAAFETIMASLDDSAAAKSLVDTVAAVFARSSTTHSSYYTRFMIAAADAHALSPGLVGALVVSARSGMAKADIDFEDSELARILAHAMGQIPTADRPVAFALIDRVASNVTPMSTATAEMYGALGSQSLDPPGMLNKVEAQAFKAKPFAPDNRGIIMEPMPGLAIVVGPGPWLAALAQYGRTRLLPARDVALLRDHVADPSLRDLIVPALVRQEGAEPLDALAGSWVRRLAALPRDSRARGTEQAIIVGDLAARPWSQFTTLTEWLRELRAGAEEPELRVALGAIIIEAQIARCKPVPRGIALFNR
jgi:hypothetical protein